MRSRVANIAWTYTQPIPLRIWAGLFAIYIVWLMMLDTLSPSLDLPLLITGGTLSAWFGAMVVAHAKEQFASPRSALMPGYRTPHLLIAVAMLIAGVVIFPIYVAMRYRAVYSPILRATIPVESIPFLTIVLVTTAIMMWIAYLQSPWMILVAFVAVGSSVTQAGTTFFRDMAAGQWNHVAAVLLLSSVCAIVLLLRRMTWMTEEMPEYKRTTGPDLRLNSLSAQNRFLRSEAKAGTGAVEEFIRGANRLDHMPNIFRAGFWRRVQHWRIVIGIGRTPVLVGGMLALWTVSLPFMVGAGDQEARFMIPIGLASMVPGLMLTSVWPRRWYTLADESLRPATRNQFLLEHVVAMAIELAMNWLIITGACLVTAVLMDLVWPPRLPITASTAILRAGPMLIAGQFLIFAGTLWLLRWRSHWLIVILMTIVTTTETALLIFVPFVAKPHRTHFSLTMASALAVIGLVILLDASRRWLRTDFD